jgi:hypothetical protein
VVEVLKKHTLMRDAGWGLIHKADEMQSELEPFPKNHFRDMMTKHAREDR